MTQYFKNIQEGIRTSVAGLRLTLRHLWQARQSRKPINVQDPAYFDQATGIVTVQYPFQNLPIPDNGRYRLHNEIDDCIVCDKCAKICPVDCISIDAIKATEEIGKASDGSPIRLYAGQFDIDMAKCCYCGLCTTVCPTECLTMTKTFDYSEFDISQMTYHFTNLTPEQAEEKKALYEQFMREKEEFKARQAAEKAAAMPVAEEAPAATPKRPVFRPGMKPGGAPKPAQTPAEPQLPAPETAAEAAPTKPAPRPAFRPSMKPSAAPKPAQTENQDVSNEAGVVVPADDPKPVEGHRSPSSTPDEPRLSQATPDEAEKIATEAAPKPAARPAFRPTMKPAAPKPATGEAADTPTASEPPAPPKPAFRPTMKPKPAPPKPGEPDAPTAG